MAARRVSSLMSDKTHRCARLGEGTRRGEPHARARTRDERDLAGEVVRGVHGCFLTVDGSRASCMRDCAVSPRGLICTVAARALEPIMWDRYGSPAYFRR